MDPARTATKATTPASWDGLEPRVAPFEDAEGFAEDPVDEGVEDEDPVDDVELVLLPVALALKASYVSLVVGLTAKTIPALQ